MSVIYSRFRLVVPYNSAGLARKAGLAYYCTASLLGQEWSDVEKIVLGEGVSILDVDCSRFI